MFDNLTSRLSGVMERVRGRGRLTEEHVREAVREVRMALLEADVALPVVKQFIEQVRVRAVGQAVMQSLTPGQAFIKVVRDELVAVMGPEAAGLELRTRPPAVILLAGLQGAGKTTSAAKLARHLMEVRKSRVLLVSTDVYRPAAIDQLERLADEIGAEFLRGVSEDPRTIAADALQHARRRHADVLIVDTAGRLHVDQAMMDEVRQLHAAVAPVETLFVVDAMSGQDAANSARAFADALPLTGVILTKADGDARGGAALSVRQVTGQPIKFLGTGEKTGALEPFQPARIASRILGMGDVLGLIEDAERQLDRSSAEQLAVKLGKGKGKGFDLTDFRAQMAQMQAMGGAAALLDKLPGAARIPDSARGQVDDRMIRRQMAIIDSMTPLERRRPEIIKGSRRRRIAAGSGTQVQDVNRLLKQFDQAQRMMKQLAKGGMGRLMQAMRGGRPGRGGRR